MSRQLDPDDGIALLRHYEIDIAEGRSRGTSIVISGGTAPGAESAISIALGGHSAQRICPITDFLAAGMLDELGDSQLKKRPQLTRSIAHLLVKASHMHVSSALESFSMTAIIEGDHYEVLPKTITIEASHKTEIPNRLSQVR